jgi:heat-inducible transcriptional repressor
LLSLLEFFITNEELAGMPPTITEPVLNERARLLLKALVDRYIREGQPVGSRTLARDSGLDLSPATIRNVMADLEELGLVCSPHTSAGRVPTVQGYRFFVDTLLEVAELDREAVQDLAAKFEAGTDRATLMSTASSILSEVTNLAGIVMLPRGDQVRLRQVEFLSLSEDQVLVILVVNEREVQNRIIRTGRRYSASELQQAANYLNEVCAGKDLYSVRDHMLRELEQHRERMNRLMLTAIQMAEKAFATEPAESDFLVAGQTKLMEYGELADMERLRHLFEAFSRKRDILHLLDESLRAEGVQIFIGEESGYDVLGKCSVVTSPYGSESRVVGVLGVIGPTRMPYDRVIPIVDCTARLLGAALNKRH